MNHKEAYKALTSNQINRRNAAYSEGWTFGGEAYSESIVIVTNIKTAETHVGRREPLKSGGWSKRIKWSD